MKINGRNLAASIGERIRNHIARRHMLPMLVALKGSDDPATESFLKIKKKFAESVGIVMETFPLPEGISTKEISERIHVISGDTLVHGIIVQLPLVDSVDVRGVLNSIPPEKDPDMLCERSRESFRKGTSKILPPVVAAIEEILSIHSVALSGNIVVVGQGELVGKPVTDWLTREGVSYEVVTEATLNPRNILQTADIIISGAGVPGLITPADIKEGVVLIDAGTSEKSDSVGRHIAGDVLPSCEEKATLFTPVPGGVGPVAVAKLFENLVILAD